MKKINFGLIFGLAFSNQLIKRNHEKNNYNFSRYRNV